MNIKTTYSITRAHPKGINAMWIKGNHKQHTCVVHRHCIANHKNKGATVAPINLVIHNGLDIKLL